MMKPVFDDNGLAIKEGTLRCFYYSSVTGEYSGWSDEYINIGVSMPGYSTDIDPGEEITGMVAVFNGKKWVQKEDRRGQVVYSIKDRTVVIVDYIGQIHEGYTSIAPSTSFDEWNGKEWITDIAAKRAADYAAAEAEKQSIIDRTNYFINSKQWPGKAVMGRLNEIEKEKYNAWLDYLDALESIDISNPLTICWPQKPSL